MILIFLLLLVTAGHSQQSPVVATVGKKKITINEFQQKFKEASTAAPINPPTKEQFLEDLVRFELGVLEAKKRKLESDPIVQERIKQEIYKALLEKEIGEKINKISVNEAEMKSWYKKYPELRTSHILISFRPNAKKKDKAEARKRAKDILAKVKGSKRPFEDLVRLYTDDTITKKIGGDVGWHGRLTLVPAYYNAALRLKPKQISGLIETPFGFHIVKLTGRRSYENANKDTIRAAVFETKKKQIFDSFFKGIRPNYPVKLNKKLLGRVQNQ